MLEFVFFVFFLSEVTLSAFISTHFLADNWLHLLLDRNSAQCKNLHTILNSSGRP